MTLPNYKIFAGMAGCVVLLIANLQGQVVSGTVEPTVNHQGKLPIRPTGPLEMKFAIVAFKQPMVKPYPVDTLWSNDGTSTDGSVPTNAVTLQVFRGTYSVLLGYTSLPNMAALPVEVLTRPDARLRVWYREKRKFIKVTVDEPLHSVHYAAEASFASVAGTVEDGAITLGKLAPGLPLNGPAGPAGPKGDPGSVGPPGPPGSPPTGALVASLSANDSSLTTAGYIRVQSLPPGSWLVSAAAEAPSGRTRHTAIWTGSSMLVWGGEVSNVPSNQGGEFSPNANAWTLLPLTNVPASRLAHTAVWSGSHMIVWGGFTNSGVTATGGIYDPVSKAWRATADAGSFQARSGHTAVWAGGRMLVWGGLNPGGPLSDGAAFSPPTTPGSFGSWASLPSSPSAGARREHSAVSTGATMILWGGLGANSQTLPTGATFNTVDNQWTATPLTNAPDARHGHTAIWTGSKMIVFGGAATEIPSSTSHLLNTGAIFDPANGWTALPTAGAPAGRFRHDAVWTGTEMLIFGGEGLSGAPVSSGAAYNPTTNSWRSLPNTPAEIVGPRGVWSGSLLITFSEAGLQTLDPSPAVHFYGRF